MDLRMGNPTVFEWLLFVAMNVVGMIWYVPWAARLLTEIDRDDYERRRAAAYLSLCVVLVLVMAPWVMLGLVS